MLKKGLNIILLFFMISACDNNQEKKSTENIRNIEKADSKEEVSSEKFEAFFDRFSKDSVFQISRVEFPISYYAVDIEDNKEEYVYNKAEFWYTDFTEDSEAITRDVDAYKPVLEKGESKTLYTRKGIDNGIWIEYHFETNDKGEWYLVKIIDNSN
jgi:hypothetical protein